jgi:signal transduction histidine kinase
VAAGGLAAFVGTLVLAAQQDELYQRTLRVVLITWVTLPFILGGTIAWRRRPDSWFGPLLIAAGFVTPLSVLQWSDAPVLNTVGQLCDLLVVAVWLHVFLAYPYGKPTDRLSRGLIVAGYGVAVGLQVVVLALGGFGQPSLLAVTSRPVLAEVVQDVQLVSLVVLCLAGTGVLWTRRRRLNPSQHRLPVRLLVDTCGMSLLMVALLLVAGAFDVPGFEVIRLVTFGVCGLAPVAFLAGLLDVRLARAGAGDLLVRLRSNPSADLRGLIADALRDPSLMLCYWLPQYGTWTDHAGVPVTLPAADADRGVTVINGGAEPIAALVYDGSLRDEPELLDAVTAAASIALENGRLEAELRARLQELQGSRTRVIEAEQHARQRLERNLHDGAQQRLVALALELGLLSKRLDGDPESRARVERAQGEVAVSLEELRDIARGIHPAVVSGHGLSVALESLAARVPIPLSLRAAGLPRLPERVEVAAYYVVCESLANVVKHAQATQVAVDVEVAEGRLVTRIVDDGVGGADTERGTGLRGLADRVEALDGRLQVWSRPGGGTRVRAEIPCG